LDSLSIDAAAVEQPESVLAPESVTPVDTAPIDTVSIDTTAIDQPKSIPASEDVRMDTASVDVTLVNTTPIDAAPIGTVAIDQAEPIPAPESERVDTVSDDTPSMLKTVFAKVVGILPGQRKDKSQQEFPAESHVEQSQEKTSDEENTSFDEKSEGRNRGLFRRFIPRTTDSEATAVEDTGDDRIIVALVAAMVVGAIAISALGNMGVLDLSEYAQWVRNTFGNIFGG
jgi:hypothetical protein